MPKGPKGVRRPANTFEAAIMVGRISTGDIEDKPSKAPERAKGGKVGGISRAASLTSEERRDIAKRAANARWKRSD